MSPFPRLQDRTQTRDTLEPLSPHSALIVDNLRRRRDALCGHSPKAIVVAAEAFAVGRDESWQRIQDVRCDRSERRRREQLSGEKGLPFEDIVAMGFESEAGLRVLLGLFGTALRALGRDIVDITAEPTKSLTVEATEAGAAIARLAEAAARAESDGKVTHEELDELERIEEDSARQHGEVREKIRRLRLAAVITDGAK